MTTSPKMLARGLARKAARDNLPLGGAYREDCRSYPDIIGLFVEYATAYDEEKNLIDSDKPQ